MIQTCSIVRQELSSLSHPSLLVSRYSRHTYIYELKGTECELGRWGISFCIPAYPKCLASEKSNLPCFDAINRPPFLYSLSPNPPSSSPSFSPSIAPASQRLARPGIAQAHAPSTDRALRYTRPASNPSIIAIPQGHTKTHPPRSEMARPTSHPDPAPTPAGSNLPGRDRCNDPPVPPGRLDGPLLGDADPGMAQRWVGLESAPDRDFGGGTGRASARSISLTQACFCGWVESATPASRGCEALAPGARIRLSWCHGWVRGAGARRRPRGLAALLR